MSPSRHDSGAYAGGDHDASQAARLVFGPTEPSGGVGERPRASGEVWPERFCAGPLCDRTLQFAATLLLVHFEGAATLFDWFLKAYFEPAEACTALVKTARKVRRRVSCRFSPTPRRSF